MPEAVISNTSPLQYLHQLGYLHLLPRFYQRVRIPPAVIRELAAGRGLGVPLPEPSTLEWLHEHAHTGDPTLLLANTLGAGEREVLSLALEATDALVLIDDGRARRIGQRLGIRMTGTGWYSGPRHARRGYSAAAPRFGSACCTGLSTQCRSPRSGFSLCRSILMIL